MMLSKQKKNQNLKGKRFLISVNVMGSAGPLRFIVNENEGVQSVIETALKMYAKEGRFPALGSNINDFLLCCPFAGPEALSPLEVIGSNGARSFTLCKKSDSVKTTEAEKASGLSSGISSKGSGSWKALIYKSLIRIAHVQFMESLAW